MSSIEAILKPYDLEEIISTEPEYPNTHGLALALEDLYIKSIEKFYNILIQH